MKKVAVTGGLASGKSSLCTLFQELGAYVVSADQIVHQLFFLNPMYVQDLIALLGEEIIINGKVDRKKVAEIVFQLPEKLQKLEELIHPFVRQEIRRLYAEVSDNRQKNYPLFVVEVPLLFETESKEALAWYDVTITVTCSSEIATERFIEKTGYTQAEYIRRMSRQLSLQKKNSLANYVIENEGDLLQLKQSAQEFFNRILFLK